MSVHLSSISTSVRTRHRPRSLSRVSRWSAALCVAGLCLSACGSASTPADPPTPAPTSSIVVTPSIAMPATTPPVSAPEMPVLDGPAPALVVALLVLDAPGVPALSAASTVSEIISAADAETWAQTRTFVREDSPHDDDQGLRVSFAVRAMASDAPAPDADPRSRTVDVDGRSMTVTVDAENSIVMQAMTIDGELFTVGSLNVPEAELLDLAAGVVWTEGRVTFASGDVPPGWLDAGSTLAQMAFIGGISGSSTPAGGARVTYGDLDPGDDVVTLTTWPCSAPDPTVEARYSIDDEQERPVDIGGAETTAYTGDGEFFSFVVWRNRRQWIALSSPSRTVDDLISLAPSVRPANADEIAKIEELAR